MSRLVALLTLGLLLTGCAYGYGPYPSAPPHAGMPNGDIPGAAAGD